MIKTGDRVRIKRNQVENYLGVKTPIPEIGWGTVVATTTEEDPYLMAGWYVTVNWDDPHAPRVMRRLDPNLLTTRPLPQRSAAR